MSWSQVYDERTNVPDQKQSGQSQTTMNHDQTFRAVLIVVFLLVLPIGIYHRLKSQATREKLDRRQEGLFILATLRPVGIAFWLELIAMDGRSRLDGLVL